jgi:hypothetical protein
LSFKNFETIRKTQTQMNPKTKKPAVSGFWKIGWGARTRTWEWQNQNLLNYQLFYTPMVLKYEPVSYEKLWKLARNFLFLLKTVTDRCRAK